MAIQGENPLDSALNWCDNFSRVDSKVSQDKR